MEPVALMSSRPLRGCQGDDVPPPKAGDLPLDHEIQLFAPALGRDEAQLIEFGLQTLKTPTTS